MDFFNQTGKIALGSRLRQFAATVTEDAAKIYELYGASSFSPKWFPVFFSLSHDGPQTVTHIAEQIGHSQPSVTKIVKEMTKAELLTDDFSTQDKRKKRVGLTSKGKQLAVKIEESCVDLDSAMDEVISEATLNLWDALAEWELLLNQKSLLQRVRAQKKLREQKKVEIVPYSSAYRETFKTLNEEWIRQYFLMESLDYEVLKHPEKYILEKGGTILVALYEGEALGVCALIKLDDPDYDYEMSKMAVSPKAQGKGIGWLLGMAIAEKARDLGASKIYLESNTVLKPAINLYYKLGFEKVAARPVAYERCNIQMELQL